MSANRVIVSINGRIVPSAEASISVLDTGLLAGFGVFETMLAEDNYVFRLAEHLSRLEKSCKATGLPLKFTERQMEEFIREALESFPTDCHSKYRRMRLVLTGGNTGSGLWGEEAFDGSFIIVIQEHTLPEDLANLTAEIVASETPLHWLAGHKVLSRMMFSHPTPTKTESRKTLQILYHPQAGITEFSVASLFIRKGQQVITSPDKRVFPGICRDSIIKRWSSIAPKFSLQKRVIEISDMLEADEVIGVNSLRAAFAISELTDNTDSDSRHVAYPNPILSSTLRSFLLNR
jgi:branched-subunit amino acid aminotransferase/4-amino-4-deoxychorismate lyase